MNVVNEYGEKWNCFTEVVAFCHVMCRYFDRFLLQGVDRNGGYYYTERNTWFREIPILRNALRTS